MLVPLLGGASLSQVLPLWSFILPAPLTSPHLHLFIQLLLQFLHFSGEFALPCQGLRRTGSSHLSETWGGGEEVSPYPDLEAQTALTLTLLPP